MLLNYYKTIYQTLEGVGALQGKNCIITSIEPVENGNNVTFSWTENDGTIKSEVMFVANGKDGENGITNDELEKYLPLIGGIISGSISFKSVDNGYCGITKHHDEINDYGMLIQDSSKDGKIAAIKLCAKSGMVTFHTSTNSSNELLHAGNLDDYVGLNIPKTNFNFTNETNWSIPNTNLETFYLVKNGWCFLHVVAYCNKVANDENSIVFTELPKPPFQVYGKFFGDSSDVEFCNLTITPDGKMLLRNGTEGNHYSFTYTYPVSN